MVEQKFGLKPAQLCDFWALTGDTTNHLPGVPGIGPKTAGHLLDTHGSLDVLLVHYQQCETRVQNALQQHWQNALLTRVLARLRTDVRSEEHTSELQSRENLVCRLLLEKKKPDKTLRGTTLQTS